MINSKKTFTFSDRMAVLFLASMTLLVFSSVCFFEFLSFDDDIYVSQNPFIRGGLTLQGLQWAMTAGLTHFSIHAEYWQPLTLISRMLDVQIFGLNAGGHHLSNLLLHVSNVLLLYTFLFRVVKNRNFSFCVALIFAIHPLQVEVVAWVTSRKDALSVFFALLAFHAYAFWFETKKIKYFSIVFLFYLMSIMSKPMMVTMPALMLCLDFWPLQRIKKGSDIYGVILEKIPFWILAALAVWIPFIPHLTNLSAIQYSTKEVMFSNIFQSYGLQFYRFFIPVGFSIYQSQIIGLQMSWGWIIGGSVLLGFLIGISIYFRKKIPALLTGVFWFLMALSPVVSLQFASNRFMYFPMIGVAIFAVALFQHISFSSGMKNLTSAIVILFFISILPMTVTQLTYWRNDETLFNRALQVDPTNTKAFYILGKNAMKRGDWASAIKYYQGAINVLQNPVALAHAHFLLAQAYHSNQEPEQSQFHFEKAFKLSESQTI